MSPVVRLVMWSMRHCMFVMGLSLVLALTSGYYVAHHFRIDTDTGRLLTLDKRWNTLSTAMDRAFPQRGGSILVVVEGTASEFVDTAAGILANALKTDTRQFTAVTQAAAGPFFEHTRPLINELAHDPSLTGLANLLTQMRDRPPCSRRGRKARTR
jgi:hypothetical protein